MSESAITVERLSKRYLVGHVSRSAARYHYTALRDVMWPKIRKFLHNTLDFVRGRQLVHSDSIEEFWALRNVSFEVEQGEVLGIIGRNGAGKSTLLKILSRITEPTEGRIELKGRVASLLEVGTGFHPELTGRENIFLNGAILGMTRREVRQKFDEIVAFAEIERFVDTPVKRYSSGMYVRLAFAVAAHLEPEILLLDEVLAVGDAEFQKKCLGKLDEVSKQQGRTVLFVSHNLETILKFCSQAILLDAGSIIARGDVKGVLSSYLSRQLSESPLIDLSKRMRPQFVRGNVLILKVAPFNSQMSWSIPFGQEFAFDLWIEVSSSMENTEIGIGVFSTRGFEVASWNTRCSRTNLRLKKGTNAFRIEYHDLALLPGQYLLAISVRSERGLEDYLSDAATFEVVPSSEASEINAQALGGVIVPKGSISALDSCPSEGGKDLYFQPRDKLSNFPSAAIDRAPKLDPNW
jgi:lipopolysaccharide transport system ATP-binding protein